MYVFPITDDHLCLLTSSFQNALRRKFPAKAPTKTANTNPPKKTMQVKLVRTFPVKVCTNNWSFSRRNAVIQSPRQNTTTINVSALTTRPAQVCSRARSAWVVAVSLPAFHNSLSQVLVSILGDLVIGSFLRDDDVVWMTFDQPGIGYTHQACLCAQIVQVLCASVTHS